MTKTIKKTGCTTTCPRRVAKRAAIAAVDRLARALQGKSHTLATYLHVFRIACIIHDRWLP